MSLQSMKERIKSTGYTPREEKIINGRRILQSDFRNDPQYNKFMVKYHSKQPVDIKMYDEKYTNSYGTTMKFQTKHNDIVECGTIFYNTKLNEYWLCLESALVGDIYYEGKIAKCNRLLKWQEADGSIYEIPIINRNASQYNNGETGNSAIILASDQLFIYTQLNKHTVILDHGVKFFIDENKENPTVYELTRPDTVDYSYMGVGIMGMIVTECPYSPTMEELVLGICNYHSPTVPPPLPPDPGKTAFLITGGDTLRHGRYKTWSLSSPSSGEIPDSNSFIWEVVSDFEIIQSADGNKIKLKTDRGQHIGCSFLLQAMDNEGKILAQKTITVIAGL